MSWIIKSLVAIGIASTGAAAKAEIVNDGSLNQAKGTFIREYDNALAPLQFVKFCMNNGSECAADSAERTLPSGERAMSMLREVNSAVNASITPMQKSTNPTVARWTIAPSAGDCNDYAVTKRHQLIEMGWPSSALRLAVVLTNGGQGHLVLVARLADGDFVLDNLSASVRPWNAAEYEWISMQSAGNPRFWVAIGEHGERLRATRLAMLRTVQ
ncbi:transglutaminase-like cysteine peptidase [Bradyrhizobium huanghuaihaiense]|uniref:transglutaminase-like cysteine peptidase n=1 Tax=Bradyrhizobium huanghuaihaiense TaxID=990078 RepID=UPI0021A9B0D8|nr:transglutaminase-like cysteine peptidase [Bradyrhizobium sp. CB3035]UWU75166.1 transglutaminase-like cysteine peptidase [Bradyrhizobium sp. CB3035]